MAGSDPYDPAALHANLAAEVERLRYQVMLSWDKEEAILRRHGCGEARRVLDMGCGPGFVLAELLEAFPEAEVTGLDSRPSFVESAAAYASSLAPTRGRAVEGEAARTGLPQRSFDLILVRFLLQHVKDPTAVLREAFRLLAPGGMVAVIEADAGLGVVADPPLPEVERAGREMAVAHARRGGARTVGRRLPRLLREVGFQATTIDAVVVHSDEVGLDAFRAQMDPRRFVPPGAPPAALGGAAGATRMALERFLANPDALIMTVHLVATARRPER